MAALPSSNPYAAEMAAPSSNPFAAEFAEMVAHPRPAGVRAVGVTTAQPAGTTLLTSPTAPDSTPAPRPGVEGIESDAAARASGGNRKQLQGPSGHTLQTQTHPQQPCALGCRVAVDGYGALGVLRFFGPHAVDGNVRCGVELDSPLGRNNGTVKGHTYFSCPPKCGVLVLPVKVVAIQDNDGGGDQRTNAEAEPKWAEESAPPKAGKEDTAKSFELVSPERLTTALIHQQHIADKEKEKKEKEKEEKEKEGKEKKEKETGEKEKEENGGTKAGTVNMAVDPNQQGSGEAAQAGLAAQAQPAPFMARAPPPVIPSAPATPMQASNPFVKLAMVDAAGFASTACASYGTAELSAIGSLPGEVLVELSPPFGISLVGSNDSAGAWVTGVQPGLSAEVSGKVVVGMRFTSVDGESMAGKSKARVVKALNAKRGAQTLGFIVDAAGFALIVTATIGIKSRRPSGTLCPRPSARVER